MNLEKRLAWITTISCAVLYLLNIAFSKGIYDIGDGLSHYSIAHAALSNPEFYLDHWGKPLFNLLASPFTIFGITGVVVMNILLYIITAWAVTNLLFYFNIRLAWLAPIMLASVPVFFQTVMSGLTEVLFAAVASLSLLAFAKNRFLISAILLGLLPFARSEAYFIIPLFALMYLLLKQWYAILLIMVAPLLMSIVGWFILDDFFWIINENPYTGAKEIYGQGEFFHFIKNTNSIIGLGLSIFFVGGLIAFPFFFKEYRERRNQVFILSVLAVLAVTLGHSYIWWKGMFGSYGLHRVVATVAPFIIISSWFALDQLSKIVVKKAISVSLVGLLLVLNINSLIVFQPIMRQPSPMEALVIEFSDWYKNSPYQNNSNVWFMQPVIAYFLDLDYREGFDSKQLWELDRIKPSISIREGGLIVYDGRLSPLEGKTSKEQLFADPDLKFVKSFNSKNQNLDPEIYEILVFSKKTRRNADTLVFEDFGASRPIMEDRLKVIKADTLLKRKYFEMTDETSYHTIYRFWIEDQKVWNAPAYKLWFKCAEPLEVYLVKQFKNGEVERATWSSGEFKLPSIQDDLVSFSLVIHNSNPDDSARVYEWGLVKLE